MLGLTLAVEAAAEPRVLWSRPVDWGEIRVVEEAGLRTLLFFSRAGETVESEMSVSDPLALQLRYTQQMLAALGLWESRTEKPVEQPKFLLVGLGGGSLSKAVARQFPQATVTSVEIEPLVVEAARAWFGYQESERMLTVVDDARHFLEVTQDRYDAILLDAFDEEGAPRALRTVEFFSLLEQHLLPGGVIVSNVHYDPWLPAERYMKSASAVFSNLYAVGSPGNGAVVFSREPVSGLELWEQREAYAKRYALPVMELLTPRLSVDLEGVPPYRDADR